MFSISRRDVFVCWTILHVMVTSSHQHQIDGSDSQYDVIVIGAGAAGVAALSNLHRSGLQVLGLEATGRIGGRVVTVEYGTGHVEFGAEWMHGNNTVYELAKRAHIPIVDTDMTDFFFLSAKGTELSCDDKCKEMLFTMNVALNTISRDSVTVEDYANKVYKDYISSSPELIARRPQLDAIIQFGKNLEKTVDGSGNWSLLSRKGSFNYHEVDGPHNHYWAGETGYQGLFPVLMQETTCHRESLPIDIKLNKEVVGINWLPEGAMGPVSVQCADGSEYVASKVLITVSLGVLQASHETMFTPPLPASKVESINNMDMGAVIKMFLRYEYRWWDDEENIGFIWDDRERAMLSEEDRWLADIFGATKPKGSDNILTLWITGQQYKFLETLPLETLKLKLDELVRKFCGSYFPYYEDSAELRRSHWTTHPQFLGTYSYHGLRSDGVDDPTEGLREPLTHYGTTRLLFAGEATSIHHYSTVHGAVETGWREAERILAERCN